ncbi:MAG: hypothetical protein ACYC6M_09500 [Terriglobales bacterium]
MQRTFTIVALVAALLAGAVPAWASGHGPVFALATPTNARGGWSLDWGAMARFGDGGTASMARAMLGYGLTEHLQVSFSAPVIFGRAALPPTRLTAMMPTSPDFEGLVAWRFQTHAPRVGTRFESTAYAGLLLPGPQRAGGGLGALARAPGFYTALATGVASRSQYFWAGLGNTHYAARSGDQRPNLVSYTLAYGYRPPAGRKDYPHVDWRVFAEMTGEHSGPAWRTGRRLTVDGDQVFLGPTALVILRGYAIEGGVQFPVYRHAAPNFRREKARVALNFSYFF